MTWRQFPAGLAAVAIWVAAPALAHHSYVMFDRTKLETVTGAARDLALSNPHGFLAVMVADPKGGANEWDMEMGSSGQMRRAGWSDDSVRPGDKVTVSFHPFKDGTYGGQVETVTLTNGRTLSGAIPPPGHRVR